MSETWLPIPGHNGHYEASSHGRIRVMDRVIERRCSFADGAVVKHFYKGRILRQNKSDEYGHLAVRIGYDNIRLTLSVHSLVLQAFKGACPAGMEACHNNGVASDNRPDNLRWDTHLANNRDRLLHGTYLRGEQHHMAKLSENDIREIRQQKLKRRQVMALYGVSNSQAHRIVTGRSWVGVE